MSESCNFRYLTPTKAALFGLAVRFRDSPKWAGGKPFTAAKNEPDEDGSAPQQHLAHDAYGNRHRVPKPVLAMLEKRESLLMVRKPEDLSAVYNDYWHMPDEKLKKKRKLPPLKQRNNTNRSE